jgi:hypothetical protein
MIDDDVLDIDVVKTEDEEIIIMEEEGRIEKRSRLTHSQSIKYMVVPYSDY